MEAQTTEIALECLKTGERRVVEFKLDADPEDREGAICGGAASVLVDPRVVESVHVFERALEGLRRRKPGVLLTVITPREGGVVEAMRQWVAESAFPVRPQGPDSPVAAGRPKLFRRGGELVFAEPVRPLPRLVIAGAGHVGRAVARLGRLLDFEVTVIDDRAEYANAQNIPEADILVVGDIAAAIRRLPPAPDDYFVIVTRGHAHDAAALRECLGRGAAYVGMIGSRTKVGLMREEFLDRAWTTPAEWDAIHAPIGMEIKSHTVDEIAVSIAAELVLVRARRRAKGSP
jgi:xanthine dehydrogenase accessory factor